MAYTDDSYGFSNIINHGFLICRFLEISSCFSDLSLHDMYIRTSLRVLLQMRTKHQDQGRDGRFRKWYS